MFTEQLLRMIAGLLVGIWVARYLGPEQFGVFSYAIAFASLFSSIAKLGLDRIVVRDLVKEPEQRDCYLGTAFWLKLMGAILMLGIVAIAMQLSSSDHLTNLYVLIIASGAIFQSFEVVDFYFQSKVLSKFVSICKMTQLLISSLLKLYFIFTGAELIYFVLITLVDQVTLSLSLYMAYRFQKRGSFYGHFNKTIAKQLLKDSWPLIFSSLVVTIYMRIDQIMIKEMLGAQEVGLFSAAVRLSEVWYFIPSIITASLFPAIVSAKKISKTLYYERLQKLYDLMVLLSLLVAIPMTFFSDQLVTLLYGASYLEAGMILSIHVWTGLLVFIGIVNAAFFTNEGLTRSMLFFTSFCSILNVTLNLFLIPKYGFLGAPIATLLTQFIGFLLNGFYKPTRTSFYMQIRALLMLNILKGNFR